jgi:membrane protein
MSASPRTPHGLTLSEYWTLVKESARAWNDDYAQSMGAALAYYTAFSLAPLLVIVIAIGGLVFGQQAARGEIVAQLTTLLGQQSSQAVESLLAAASQPARGVLASALGLATLFVGATSVLAELQSSLDRIWRMPAMIESAGLIGMLRARVFSFGMVIAMGFLLLVSLVIGAVLAACGRWCNGVVPGGLVLFEALNIVVGFLITTALFAVAYRLLPRAHIKWSDVWIGAAATAVFFTLGKFGIGLYIGRAGIASAFGAAGSLIVVLVWVYYSAQIFLLGAEFTWVFAHRHGSRAQQGLPDVTRPADPAIPARSQSRRR